MPLRECLTCRALIPTMAMRQHTATHRNYTSSDWRSIRAQHLATEPRCRDCGAIATDVDHVLPRSQGGTDSDSNLQSLCHGCHSRKTATADRNG